MRILTFILDCLLWWIAFVVQTLLEVALFMPLLFGCTVVVTAKPASRPAVTEWLDKRVKLFQSNGSRRPSLPAKYNEK